MPIFKHTEYKIVCDVEDCYEDITDYIVAPTKKKAMIRLGALAKKSGAKYNSFNKTWTCKQCLSKH